MNVVIAALSAPAQLNGVSRHATNLARALLSTQGVAKLHFLAGEWQAPMFRSVLDDGDPRLHIHWIALKDANFSRILWYFRELPCIAAQLDADIVHLTYPAPIASKAFHCPTALSLHDLYPFDIPQNFGFWKSAFARKVMTRCIKNVDAIACVSASTKARLEEWFPAEINKATVIPNVVELKPLASPDRPFERLNGRSFVLCVAQHRRNKNVPLAIRAFARALATKTLAADSRLFIVGIPGPETTRIQAQIRETGLVGKVLLGSGLSDAELRWCYENCDVLLVPSEAEGFGLPVAEGLLAGCRIVCSDIPAFWEVGGGACRYVSWEGDLPGLYADAIRLALTLPKPARASLPQFSLQVIGRDYLRFYQDLICSRVSGFDMLRQPKGPPKAVRSRSA
jgi:glycosyltransferase involved in cell wall biosynthesis